MNPYYDRLEAQIKKRMEGFEQSKALSPEKIKELFGSSPKSEVRHSGKPCHHCYSRNTQPSVTDADKIFCLNCNEFFPNL